MSKEVIQNGLDDGPPLMHWAINAWRDIEIIKMRQGGASLRAIAKVYGMSYEGIRGRLRKNGVL